MVANTVFLKENEILWKMIELALSIINFLPFTCPSLQASLIATSLKEESFMWSHTTSRWRFIPMPAQTTIHLDSVIT